MRDIFPNQRTLGEVDIADITIDVRSRDDIPLILLGLQHIYCTPELKQKILRQSRTSCRSKSWTARPSRCLPTWAARA